MEVYILKVSLESHELYEILCLKVEIHQFIMLGTKSTERKTAQYQNPPVTDARYEIHPKQFY